MLTLPDKIITELKKRSKYVVPVVEIYERKTDDIVSTFAPFNALGRFAMSCFTWNTSQGSYVYDAKVKEFPSIETFVTEELNTAEIIFSNVKRGEGSMARFVLNNHIKGCWMVIRLIFPDLDDTSHVIFWGKCERPGGINSEELTIMARQDMGNFSQEIPFRTYGPMCPLEFAKPYGGCLGNQLLIEKSVAYQQAVATYGTAGCNKLYTTCALLGNTNYFQGQRVVAVSGQFSYVTIEEVVKRVLFWTKRKKIQVVKTDNWSSVNQSEGSETVPIAFGRCQIQGHPIVWADVGQQVRALYGFCEGKISAYTFIRSRTEGINIVSTTEHLGDWGGVGTQVPDLLFGGASGVNSRLAYLEILTDGSSPTQVDDAPVITAVIRGLEIPVPDASGNYTLTEWTNNPVHVTRFLLTDGRFGRVPTERIDDEVALQTAADCDEIVEDRTNEETLVLPSNEAQNYGHTYRRFRSSGRYTAYKDMWNNGAEPGDYLDEYYPEFENPEVRWYNPFQQYIIPTQQTVLRQKYTFNGALQEKTPILDFLNERVFPTYKGFLNYAPNGKIQIKNRRKADNAYIRDYTNNNDIQVPVTNISPWRNDLRGYLLIGVSLEEAEIREVVGFEYSTACNGTPITATIVSEGLTAITTPITGGTRQKPGIGRIKFFGTPAAGNKITITIASGDDAFDIEYVTDGVEDLNCVARMVTAFLNANVQFHSNYTAYILNDDLAAINIRCESGYLTLDEPTEYEHQQGEEVMRVEHVFENCGELTANTSARFDNIIEGTFRWNEQETDEINAITAKYTAAVDDFRSSILMPRAAWDTIDLEGELAKEELDLMFVDNYWQAAYLAKGTAIDRIDGNIHFTFDTNLNAIALELGDVVAVRHDSGDGALNYVPVWITKIAFNIENFTVEIGAKLYLTAAFDYHIQPIDPLLTTTLNTNEIPTVPPEIIGTNGGVGGGTTPVINRPDHGYYKQFEGLGVYSPTGLDKV